jgi:hypothetical protein
MLDELVDIAPRFAAGIERIGFDARVVRNLQALMAKRREELAK